MGATKQLEVDVNFQKLTVTVTMAVSLVACGSSNTADTAAPSQSPAASAAARGTLTPALRSTIATTLKIDESKVTPDASFAKDLGADELSMVELVMAYEREFKVDIRDADADQFKQVKDVVTYLQKHNALR